MPVAVLEPLAAAAGADVVAADAGKVERLRPAECRPGGGRGGGGLGRCGRLRHVLRPHRVGRGSGLRWVSLAGWGGGRLFLTHLGGPSYRPWHFLYFLPLPHQQGSLRPSLVPAGTGAVARPPLGLAGRGGDAWGFATAGGGGGPPVHCTPAVGGGVADLLLVEQ